MFISVDGKAKEVKEIFAGGADGKAHKITEVFGGVNGVAKRLYSSEKETNAFDQFTWAEIKQLANEGKLLEHFNKYDKVTIDLKETLVSDEYTYFNTEGFTDKFRAKQDKLILHITNLTETSMRLTSPYASVLCKNILPGIYKNDGFAPWTVSTETSEPYQNTSITVTTVDYGKSFYWRINDLLPDDLKEAAVGYETLRKTVTYSGSGTTNTKEMCCVRNMSEPINFVVTQHKEEMPYWYEITETQFPRKKSAFFYHYEMPKDFKSVANGSWLKSRTFLYSTGSSDTNRRYYYTDAPALSYDWNDKYTKPDDDGVKTMYSYYYANQQGYPVEDRYSAIGEHWTYIPEISITADA